MPTVDADEAVPRWRALRRTLLSAGALLAIVACYSFAPVPRQAWDEGRFGPLVPHKSFPADCSLCHVPERWDVLKPDFKFDHVAATGVALEGAHAQASCLRCHNDRGPVREFIARGCGGCHVDPHDETLGTDCTSCHDQATWQPGGRFAEHARTRFPLVGAHLALACDRCHEQARIGRFVGAPTQCDECHSDDATRSTKVDHLALGYVSDCQRCHSPTVWSNVRFRHTSFALAGAHAALACDACHQNGVFSGTPRDCYSCHADDYAATSSPPHQSSGFGTNCEQCHLTTTWGSGGFNHSTFPLTGAHAGAACDQCHVGGVYAGTPRDCYSCHQADYDGTTNPDHAASGFGTGCEQCHATSAWVPSTFDHDAYFPIDSGAHRNIACAECHTTGNNSQFSCIDCHDHSKSQTDSHHRDVNGYRYASADCYRCHRNGKGD